MKFGNIFKKTKNSEYEQRLKNEFGLSRKGKDWAYYGRGALDENTQKNLYDAKTCLDCIDYIREENKFDMICIVPGKPTIISCNTNPPMAIASSISAEEGGELIHLILSKTKSKVLDYRDTFMLRLP